MRQVVGKRRAAAAAEVVQAIGVESGQWRVESNEDAVNDSRPIEIAIRAREIVADLDVPQGVTYSCRAIFPGRCGCGARQADAAKPQAIAKVRRSFDANSPARWCFVSLHSPLSTHHSPLRLFILYRYLLREFLQVFVICFCSLDGLYIMIDAFGNLDEFIRYGEKHGGVMVVIFRYYAYRSISFFDITSGIVALIAAMFTLAMFQRFNELTALLAAGIPKRRILKPVVAAVATIALLAAASRELLIPAVRDKLSLDVHDLAGEKGQTLHPKLDFSTSILISGRETVAKRQEIHDPNFLLPATLDSPFKQIQATNANYRPADADHPGGYLLSGVKEPKDIARRPSLPKADPSQPRRTPPVIFTSHDYPWLAADECFVASDITFQQLVGADSWRRFASTLELIRGLHNPSLNLGGDATVAIHARPLQPVLDLTLLFLGLPLVLRRGNGNMFVAIGLCLCVVVGFMLVVLGAQSAGSNFLIPATLGGQAMGAWLPVLIFVPLAVAMSDPLRE